MELANQCAQELVPLATEGSDPTFKLSERVRQLNVCDWESMAVRQGLRDLVLPLRMLSTHLCQHLRGDPRDPHRVKKVTCPG